MAITPVSYLTYEEFTQLLGFIKTQAEFSIAQIKEDIQQLELQTFNEYLKITPSYLFFIPRQIDEVYSDMMSSQVKQDYVFNLTSLFSVVSHLYPFNRNKIIDTVVDGISNSFSASEISILSAPISKGLSLSREDLTGLLSNNYWLVTLYFLQFSFRES